MAGGFLRIAGVIGVGLSLQVGGATGRDGDKEGMVGVGWEDWVGAGAEGEGAEGTVGAGTGMDTGR